MAAVETGDEEALVAMLAEDAVAYTDGGGKVRAAPRPIVGADKVARFATVTARRGPGFPTVIHRATVNGRPGRVVAAEDGTVYAVLELDIADDRIRAVHLVSNPDKLRHLPPVH